jgi:hypothetical protein
LGGRKLAGPYEQRRSKCDRANHHTSDISIV